MCESERERERKCTIMSHKKWRHGIIARIVVVELKLWTDYYQKKSYGLICFCEKTLVLHVYNTTTFYEQLS